MTARGFYFAGMDKHEANAMRHSLNWIAAELGYIAKRGKTAGQGNFAALMIAMAQEAPVTVDLLMPFHTERIRMEKDE